MQVYESEFLLTALQVFVTSLLKVTSKIKWKFSKPKSIPIQNICSDYDITKITLASLKGKKERRAYEKVDGLLKKKKKKKKDDVL